MAGLDPATQVQTRALTLISHEASGFGVMATDASAWWCPPTASPTASP